MQRIYEEFIESLSESVDDKDLQRSMALLTQAFDLTCFAYLSLPSRLDDCPRAISNYPSRWRTFYLRRCYQTIDPVVRCARCSDKPFCWGKRFGYEGRSEIEAHMFEEAAAFGILGGVTIPIHDRRGDVSIITFARDFAVHNLPGLLDRNERAFQLAATCFHIHVRRINAADHVVDGVRLTRRELECLRWAAKGKSARDIGHILGITRRTAAFHLDNAREKLGVRTITQAVARLASSGRFPE